MSEATPSARQPEPPADPSSVDHRVVLHGVSWEQYEAILAIRGDEGGTRLTYLQGELEIMTPSRQHETLKTLFGRLLEAYAEEAGIELNGAGSWTIRSAPKERGLEPDECYVIGDRETEVPDIALEVVWTSGLVDKMEVYRGLGVREVWVWRKGRIDVNLLRGDRYERAARSELLPGLDLELLATFLGRRDQTTAVREFRAVLRGEGPRRG